MFKQNNKYYKVTIELVQKAQKDMEPTVVKVTQAQEAYLQRNNEIYTQDEMETIRYFLDAFLYKYQIANYSLEQLWVMRDAKVEGNILDIVRNTIVSLELTEDEVFLQSHYLEQFLFQSRSCLDFFMLYITKILRTRHVLNMSVDKFYTALSTANPEVLCKKADTIDNYFREHVFSAEKNVQFALTPNWGELLRSLRDRIAHRDRINISKNSRDRILNDILLAMPTLQNMTYEKFCQTIENGMYEMIRDLFPVVYDLEWKAGPYREGMFEN